MQETKQKKRFIIKLNDDIYLLKSKGPVFWTQFADEATLLSKKKAGKEKKRLQSHYPAVQILEWKPPKPGRWEPLKPKLQPVTLWPPLKANNEAKAATDEAFSLDEALGRFYTGINYLATNKAILGARGQMILTKSMTSYRDKKKALLDIGWELKEHPDDGYLWAFAWGKPSIVELTKKQGSNIAKGYAILEKYGLASICITPQEHQVSRENRLKETAVTPEDMEILKSLGWQPDSRINTGWKYLETLTPSVMGKVRPNPVTDSEARLLDSSGVTRWHYDEGTKLFGDNCIDIQETARETIVYTSPIKSSAIISRITSHGFEPPEWEASTGRWKWVFCWNRWEAEAKETEAEADSDKAEHQVKLIQSIYDGLVVAFQYDHEFNLTDSYAEIVFEGEEVPMDTDILSKCGWERMESSGDGDAIWHFGPLC